MKYRVRWVHKVTQICACSHSQGSHRALPLTPEGKYAGSAPFGEGACSCGCPRFESRDIGEAELPQELPHDRKAAGAMLRLAGLLCAGQRLRAIRHEPGGRIVCFPDGGSSWQSIIFERETP